MRKSLATALVGVALLTGIPSTAQAENFLFA